MGDDRIEEDVVARSAIEDIHPAAAEENVVARTAGQNVVAGTADEEVIAVATIGRELNAARQSGRIDDVVPAEAVDDKAVVGRFGAGDGHSRRETRDCDDAAARANGNVVVAA